MKSCFLKCRPGDVILLPNRRFQVKSILNTMVFGVKVIDVYSMCDVFVFINDRSVKNIVKIIKCPEIA